MLLPAEIPTSLAQEVSTSIPEEPPEPQSYWIELHDVEDFEQGIPDVPPEPTSLDLDLYPYDDANDLY